MDYVFHIGVFISIYGILALGLNLLAGYTGLVSVAQAGLYGLGAYGTALSLTRFGLSFFPALFIGCLLSGIVAFFIGLILSRFRDDYYILATLGFNGLIFSILMNAHSVTRGPLGIGGIPKPSIFGIPFISSGMFFLFAASLMLLVYILLQAITKSSFGRALQAIREDEQVIQVFGYKTEGYKLLVFVVAGFFSGLAGGLYATYITFIEPFSFLIAESVFILTIVILGGLANLRGSIIGAIILVILPEALRFVGFPQSVAAELRQVVYGVLLVVLMLYRPRGIVGRYKF